MPTIPDLPNRYALANELHARPNPRIDAPCRAAFLAIKQPVNAAARDKAADLDHLVALLDRHGAPHPKPGDTHWSGMLGRSLLKWENHTEFATYTIFEPGSPDRSFDGSAFALFPEDWLAKAPGARLTSALIEVEVQQDDAAIKERLTAWFADDSLAVSRILDGDAVVAGDFRIDARGHMRFALFTVPGCGPQRVGRIVQRLTEIETYKAMAMLGLMRVRDIAPDLGALDRRLTDVMARMVHGNGDAAPPEETLSALLETSADLEALSASAAFRLGATRAYEAIVTQRIAVLREARFAGRQTFSEFMMRRFDPAMRTVVSTEARLARLADRAARAADLLRTRVDVDRSAQNQALLASMDRRADLALRLQHTVEGLSVVAISYYAVSLVVYLLAPAAEAGGLDKSGLAAVVVLPVVLAVWWMVRRIRRSMH